MESLEYKGVPGGGVAAYRIEDNKLSFLNSNMLMVAGHVML